MKNYRAVIAGAGFIGLAHLEALRRLGNVEVTAFCVSSQKPELAEKTNVPSVYTDYREMILAEKPDTVHICTPNVTHYEMAKFALENGVSVLCEKPFTMEIEEAEELAALAKEKGLYCGINFHNRFYPMVQHMKKTVESGEMGKVLSASGSYLQDWLLFPEDYSWRLESKKGGKTRAVSDIGSHWMDLMEFVTGMRITEVMACFSRVYDKRKKPLGSVQSFGAASERENEEIAIDTEDEAVVMFKTNTGAIGTFTVSQVFSGKKNELCLKVAGSKGAMQWQADDPEKVWFGKRDTHSEIRVKEPWNAEIASYPAGHMEGFPDALKETFKSFYRGLSGSKNELHAKFEDGVRSMKLCDAIFESAKSNTWVKI